MRQLFFFLMVFLTMSSTFEASTLSDAADAMSADTWAALTTNGISTSTLLEAGGSTGNITSDGDQGCYDPVRQEVHLMAKGHFDGQPVRHVVYDVATNTWLRRGDVPGINLTGGEGHSWDYGPVCDSRGRIVYRGRYNSRTIERYNMDSQTWLTSTTPSTSIAVNNGFQGVAWNYERGTAGQLVVAGQESGTDGLLYGYDVATDTWARINSSLLSRFPSYSFAEYSEVHKVTLFGSASEQFRLLRTRGTLSDTAAPPSCGYSGGNRDGIIHADPVTGNFVMLCGSGSASWQIYNPISNSWTSKPAPSGITDHVLNLPHTSGTWPTWGAVGIPITDHGVIMYVKCNAGTSCGVRLYKGGTFTAADRDFKKRCYKPGVISCFGFDTPNDIDGSTTNGVVRWGTGSQSQQSSQKSSGLMAIQYDIPSNSSMGSTHYWQDNFRDDLGRSFGAGEEFYIQWRQRFSPCLLYTGANDTECLANGAANNWTNRRVYNILEGDAGGWKLAIINESERPGGGPVFSAGDISLVVQDTSQRGLLQHYYYTNVGQETGDFNDGTNIHIQYDQANRNCLYPGPYTETGCVRYRPNQWMTIQLHFKISSTSPWNTNNGTFEMWIAQEAAASVRVMRRDPLISSAQKHGNANPSLAKYGKIWLTPYHTNKDPAQAHAAANTWYDELIISTQKIDDPGFPTAPSGPAPPTGFIRVP